MAGNLPKSTSSPPKLPLIKFSRKILYEYKTISYYHRATENTTQITLANILGSETLIIYVLSKKRKKKNLEQNTDSKNAGHFHHKILNQ